jgi:hypothetical protein
MDPNMTDRDELANEIIGIQERILSPIYVSTRSVALDIADAVLSRWRLVPVDNDVRFYPDPDEAPLQHVYHGANGQNPCARCEEQHRAAGELTRHDQDAGHYE